MKETPVWKIESLANGPLPYIRGRNRAAYELPGWHQARQIRGAYVEPGQEAETER